MNSIKLSEQKETGVGQKNIDRTALFGALDIDWNFLKLLPGFDGILIRSGFYSAKYFNRTAEIVGEIPDENQIVTMQIFQKTPGAMIAGVNVVQNLLKVTSGYYKDEKLAMELLIKYISIKQDLEVLREKISIDPDLQEQYLSQNAEFISTKKQIDALWMPAGDKIDIEILTQDGKSADRFEPVIKVRGPYKYFAKLESVYLGILARATKVATNTAKVVAAANGKPVLFFADRFDNFSTQNLDGYASLLGGASGVATDAQGFYNGKDGIGTMPHALIATFDGNTPQATLEFAKKNADIPLISLVDFDNDCPQTALDVAKFIQQNGYKLNGVRLDTSGSMVDESLLFDGVLLDSMFGVSAAQAIRSEYLENKKNNNVIDNSLFSAQTLIRLKDKGLTGVNPYLVFGVRRLLDQNGFQDVKIFVSGGFTAEKIDSFERGNVPVDGYGVGSSLLAPKYVSDNGDFTADIVSINGKAVCKVGRKEF